MDKLDTVREIAKELLTSASFNGDRGFLWAYAQRLVCNVEGILQLPELSSTDRQIDEFSLYSATYFCQTAVAEHLEKGDSADKIHFNHPQDVERADCCTKIVARKLNPVVGGKRVKKINTIITESWTNSAQMIEAKILSDARNLEDIGTVGIFNEFRRFINEGKSIFKMIGNWQKKIDYRYWQARLKNSFQFEGVRNLAAKRLLKATEFMNQLDFEVKARDLKEQAIESKQVSQTTDRRVQTAAKVGGV